MVSTEQRAYDGFNTCQSILYTACSPRKMEPKSPLECGQPFATATVNGPQRKALHGLRGQGAEGDIASPGSLLGRSSSEPGHRAARRLKAQGEATCSMFQFPGEVPRRTHNHLAGWQGLALEIASRENELINPLPQSWFWVKVPGRLVGVPRDESRSGV